MKITVISAWYNEQDMAPFFLENYSWADEVIVLLDVATTDDSARIVPEFSNARIEPCASPGGLVDDGYLIGLKNYWAGRIAADWIISVDADELIIPPDDGDFRRVLAGCNGNVIHLHCWQVWKNAKERKLDPEKPAIWQRRHGDPNRMSGPNGTYKKPVIFKPESQIKWYPGQHRMVQHRHTRPSACVFDGAHWSMADVEMAVRRRIEGRRDRISEQNKVNRWGYQWYDVTEEWIRAECKKHLHDPRLF